MLQYKKKRWKNQKPAKSKAWKQDWLRQKLGYPGGLQTQRISLGKNKGKQNNKRINIKILNKSKSPRLKTKAKGKWLSLQILTGSSTIIADIQNPFLKDEHFL